MYSFKLGMPNHLLTMYLRTPPFWELDRHRFWTTNQIQKDNIYTTPRQVFARGVRQRCFEPPPSLRPSTKRWTWCSTDRMSDLSSAHAPVYQADRAYPRSYVRLPDGSSARAVAYLKRHYELYIQNILFEIRDRRTKHILLRCSMISFGNAGRIRQI